MAPRVRGNGSKRPRGSSRPSKRPRQAETAMASNTNDDVQVGEGSGIDIQFHNSKHAANYRRLERKGLLECGFVDWEVCERWGLKSEMEQYLSVGNWASFFNIIEPSFSELTLEFLASFEMSKMGGFADTGKISFQLKGQVFKMTVPKFGIALGIYSDEYVKSSEYARIIRTTGNDNDVKQFFREIAVGRTFIASRSKAAGLMKPSLRYLHALIARSLYSRHDSVGAITAMDLHVIRCMVKDIPADIAHLFAKRCASQVNASVRGQIGIGPYVTRLAKNLFNLEFDEHDPLAIKMKPLDEALLVKMGVLSTRMIHGIPTRYFPDADPGVAGDGGEEDNADEEYATEDGGIEVPNQTPRVSVSNAQLSARLAICEDRLNTLTVGQDAIRNDTAELRNETREVKGMLNKILSKLCGGRPSASS